MDAAPQLQADTSATVTLPTAIKQEDELPGPVEEGAPYMHRISAMNGDATSEIQPAPEPAAAQATQDPAVEPARPAARGNGRDLPLPQSSSMSGPAFQPLLTEGLPTSHLPTVRNLVLHFSSLFIICLLLVSSIRCGPYLLW